MRQTQVLQAQKQTLLDYPHAEVEIKPQMKPRGRVAKEEDPKPSQQLYSCRLNPHNQLGRLCVYGIYKRTLRAPTKENTRIRIAVDKGGKNTQKTRLESDLPQQQVQRPAALEGTLGE